MNSDFPVLSEGAVKNLEKKIQELGKPSIFIGSSRERIPLAEYIKSLFDENLFNVDCWYDGVFGPTIGNHGDVSNLEWLKNFTDIYDFGVFLFTEDDYVTNARGRRADSVRHNIVFEFGLFLGRIGASRSYIIKTDKTDKFINDFFSDLRENIGSFTGKGKNILLSIYEIDSAEVELICSSAEDKKNTPSCLREVFKIQASIIETFKTPEISFLPATTLAIGYFKNLIADFFKLLSVNSEEVNLENESNRDIKRCLSSKQNIELTVLLPRVPDDGSKESIDKVLPNAEFGVFSIRTHREKPVKVLNSSKQSLTVKLFDVATTLLSSYEAIIQINLNPDIRELLWAKELKNFKIKLEALFIQEKLRRPDLLVEFELRVLFVDVFLETNSHS